MAGQPTENIRIDDLTRFYAIMDALSERTDGPRLLSACSGRMDWPVRGVYFFDEFDALGTQRSSPNDVGEARRILNSFLQMIEQDDSNSVIVCATNHVQMLDYALFRRFDDVIKYNLPGKNEIQRLFNSRLKPYMDDSVSVDGMVDLAEGLSAAEVTLAAQDAIKEMLIHGHEAVTQDDLRSAVEDRRRMSHQVHKQE